MQPTEGLHRLQFTLALAVAKADATDVTDKGVERVQVAPTGVGLHGHRSRSLRRSLCQSYRHQRALPRPGTDAVQYMQKPTPVGTDQGLTRQVLGKKVIELLCVVAGASHWAGRNRGSCRWWRYWKTGSRWQPSGGAVGSALQAVQPVVGHLGVTVEQENIVVLAERHATIDCGDKSEVLGVVKKGDAAVGVPGSATSQPALAPGCSR
jgi:hypothetical protein